ncbi:ROK family protein [Allobranchiibius sp. CTAmp26]|uniref:ROK family protein n=1 Tax=Allobranchiibius sp. CTAmp26 TaxID=2815214 RepID=UPI001AA16BE3|nr:ROK family protein [Allobranchiibius sp. CTAmp26]MBO1754550.1 ROK family protein [Allobranchiibius sp. CTAmp26]
MTRTARAQDAVVGVDLGGTKTNAALIDREGHILRRATSRTPGRGGPGEIVRTVGRLVEQVGRHAHPLGVGVGSAGVIDHVRGEVVSATSVLRDWAGTPIRQVLEQWTGLPVVVDNDVHTHALGELWRGRAREVHSMLLVAVGTGVGASLVLDGEVWHGARHVAGHLGHIVSAYADGRPCVCGGWGHLESVASGPAICAEVARQTGEPVDRLQDVVHAADAGSAIETDALRQGALALGVAVGGVVNLLDPQLVVVTGGVTGAGPSWWTAMDRALRAELLPATRDVPVLDSELGADAALLGAARMAFERTSRV